MTENLTPDRSRSTSTTRRSKALSTDAATGAEPPEAEPIPTAVDEAGAAPEPPPDLRGKLPGWIVKLGGIAATVAAMDADRKALKLPGLQSKDYRFVLGFPGGVPITFPVTVIYKPESPQEQVLGTYRIGR